jgi:hypothetical protein
MDIGLQGVKETGRGVLIAFIDGAVQLSHPDLVANLFTLNGALRWGALPVTFDAQAGPLARLLGAPGPAWPLRLRAELAGGQIQAEGEMREPRGLSAYHFDITANLPDPAALATLLRQPWPPLGALSLRGRLVGDGTGQPPRAEDLTLTLGPTRLPPMLALSQARLHIPTADQPAQLSLRGERGGEAFTLDGQIGPLAGALQGGALPMALTIGHLGAAATLRGEHRWERQRLTAVQEVQKGQLVVEASVFTVRAMAAQGRNFLFIAPHISVIPSLGIFMIVLAFNLLGDALRDALDPRLRI